MRRIGRQINVEVVKRSDAGRFVVRAERWIVDRLAAPVPQTCQLDAMKLVDVKLTLYLDDRLHEHVVDHGSMRIFN